MGKVVYFGVVVWGLLVSIAWDGPVGSSDVSRTAPVIVTPAPGSSDRRGILDAVRRMVPTSQEFESKFKVDHLKVAGGWAYLRCNEIIQVEREWQETDLTVVALLQREGAGSWVVRDCWALPTESERPYRRFQDAVQDLRRQHQLPDALFPSDP